MSFQILLTKQAQAHWEKLCHSGHDALRGRVEHLLQLVSEDPLGYPPPFKKLQGELQGLVSKRINYQHRLVYQVFEADKKIKVVALWTHYGD